MEVVVDGQGGRRDFPPGAPFGEVFDALRREAASRRRLVLSLTLDGGDLPPERQEALRKEVPSSGARLEVRTADAAAFLDELLSNLLELAGNLERGQGEVAGRLVAGEYTKALEILKECLSDWDLLIHKVRDASALCSADFRILPPGGATFEERIRKLRDALARFRDAFGAGDAVRLGDIAQHELKLLAGEWRALIEALRRHAAAVPGPAP